MGVSSYLPTPDNMKCFVILSLAACSFAAPAADADAQYLAYGHGLVGGVYSSAPVAYHHAIAAPLVVAAPAVAEVKAVEVKAAPAVVPAAYHIAAPAAYHVAAPAAYHVAAPAAYHV